MNFKKHTDKKEPRNLLIITSGTGVAILLLSRMQQFIQSDKE